jgi:predicted nucleic acid-binding protein
LPLQAGPDRPHLIDSSVWIDWFRNVDGAAAEGLDDLLDREVDVATTEPVLLELFAGARSSVALGQMEEVMAGVPLLSVAPHLDFHRAAALYRDARSRGRTVRRLMDCLIAAVALRHDAVLVHKDADFDAIGAAANARWISFC